MRTTWLFLAAILVSVPAIADGPPKPPEYAAPDLQKLIAVQGDKFAEATRQYDVDRATLLRTYPVPASPIRYARLARFYQSWRAALNKFDRSKLGFIARLDYSLLRIRVNQEWRHLKRQASEEAAIAPLLPFAATIVDLEETRRRMDPVDPVKAAGRVARFKKLIDGVREEFDDLAKSHHFSADQINQAADLTTSLRFAFRNWFSFYDGYDPLFSWWLAQPYKEAEQAIQSYIGFLKDKAKESKFKAEEGEIKPFVAPVGTDAPDLANLIAEPRSELAVVLRRFMADRFSRGRMSAMGLQPPGQRSPERISRFKKFYSDWLAALGKLNYDQLSLDGQIDYQILRTHIVREIAKLNLQAKTGRGDSPRGRRFGGPIGAEALKIELAGEMIPYTPDECIAIAQREAVWCQNELKKASREMGFGDDWKKAIEQVKTLHVEPGKQPILIRDLANEAVEYMNKFNLVTIPPLAQESWRMEMMTPQRQLVSPFFTGGEVISVSFPTNTMSHEAKLQSLRGNNIHFSRATVQHELIPGHHLQQFFASRQNTQRAPFATPFWTEGFAVYWEFVLWDRGFPRSPEDRIGMLFWRLHRCARIVFSFNYHSQKWDTKECVDYLVRTVGHERDNAAAEVRRSFGGGYGPLYQAAYLLGALQLRQLRHELVDSGKMREKDFHDALYLENRIPIELLRAKLMKQKLPRDHVASWRFYGVLPSHDSGAGAATVIGAVRALRLAGFWKPAVFRLENAKGAKSANCARVPPRGGLQLCRSTNLTFAPRTQRLIAPASGVRTEPGSERS